MAAYTNLSGGLQAFYFAQIERVHAGKTMDHRAVRSGEVSGNGFLRIQSPDGNAYNYATFDWRSDDGRSGTDVTRSRRPSTGPPVQQPARDHRGAPATELRATGLDPPGDATDEEGWWRIEYNVSGANDTTTWRVSIRGNPVHLVLP